MLLFGLLSCFYLQWRSSFTTGMSQIFVQTRCLNNYVFQKTSFFLRILFITSINSPTQPKVVINKKISNKLHQPERANATRDIWLERIAVVFLLIIVQKGKEM
ncbi:Hypothetical_protein [Hexamita inflata]|uniref:Hypothetical_protein n=1 Tax=Hexamita inflata TaxID=28002 RepID=A0AA86U4Z7_9EUKA|nr:Hypothetical protein HINF_LOCUS25772 [Hexamita inflata]